jgi:hypothetical protein
VKILNEARNSTEAKSDGVALYSTAHPGSDAGFLSRFWSWIFRPRFDISPDALVDATVEIGMTDEDVEKFAIRAALGRSDAMSWLDGTSEDHKNHWRRFIRDLEAAMIHDMES